MPRSESREMDLPGKYLLKGILFTLQIIDLESVWALRAKKAYEIPIMYAQHKSKGSARKDPSFQAFKREEHLAGREPESLDSLSEEKRTSTAKLA